MTLSHPVVTEPPFSPPDVSVDLLKELASALDELGPVVDTTLEQLTVEEMSSALNALDPRGRQITMRAAG